MNAVTRVGKCGWMDPKISDQRQHLDRTRTVCQRHLRSGYLVGEQEYGWSNLLGPTPLVTSNLFAFTSLIPLFTLFLSFFLGFSAFTCCFCSLQPSMVPHCQYHHVSSPCAWTMGLRQHWGRDVIKLFLKLNIYFILVNLNLVLIIMRLTMSIYKWT